MATHVHDRSPARGWVVKLALVVTVLLVATEFVAGHISGSLALTSDAWHNLSDLPTLVLSWLALHYERKPPDARKTFGYQRAGVLAAFVNSIILLGVAGFIVYEGYQRIVHPQPVATGIMMVVGVVALVTNASVSLGLARGRNDLNLRSVFVHYLGDALSNLGIIAGAWLIQRTGQPLIDPLVAFLIAVLTAGAYFRLVGYDWGEYQYLHPDERFLTLVETHRPDQVTLVPDDPSQGTSDHGWDIAKNSTFLGGVISRIRRAGLRVSLFVDPDPAAPALAKQVGAGRVEIYTGPYGGALDPADAKRELAKLAATGKAAAAAGLGLNAGHDLTRANLPALVAALPNLLEVSIGHAITADALTFGMAETVRLFRHAIGDA